MVLAYVTWSPTSITQFAKRMEKKAFFSFYDKEKNYLWISILVPRGRAPFGQHQESRHLASSNGIQFLNGFVNTIDWDQNQSDLSNLTLNMRRVTGSPWITDFRCWTWPEVAILGADQKERGLWGREWWISWNLLRRVDSSNLNYPPVVTCNANCRVMYYLRTRTVLDLVVSSRGGGGCTPRKIGWGCAARFPKPLPYLWPKPAKFPTVSMTWPLNQNLVLTRL